jgi:proteasome lid subunit RPN8/RPN11
MANITIRTRPGTATHLLRPRPENDGLFQRWITDDNGFFVYVHSDVLEFIRNEAKRALPDETIGLLAGRVCEDPQTGPYTMIVAAENARPGEFEASPAHVRLRGPGQAHVRRRLEDAHPDREIVGWYHTHPNYPSKFSSVDMHEQRTWSDRNHVGIVYSTNDPEPFGVYRSPEAIRLRPVVNTPVPLPRRPVPLPPAPPDADLVQSPPTPPAADYLTPHHGPLEVKPDALTKTPAALPSRLHLVILSIMAIVIVGQMAYLFRLDRRLSFNEGRMHEVTAAREALQKIAERLAAQPSSTLAPAATPVESVALESDGPELRLPAKPLKSQTPRREQDPSRRRRARAAQIGNNKRRTGNSAQKPATAKGSKTSASPVINGPKPERTPK